MWSELEFDELTLDLYYKEGKGISSLCAEDGYDYKRQVQFLTFQLWKDTELHTFNCTRR
jgi:alpha-glucosidase